MKGLTDALRVELAESGTPVSVTLVRPPAIDTLFNDHAKSYLPSAPTFPPPVYSPEVVARSILYACEHPQRDVYIGNSKLFTRMSQLAPGLTDMLNSHIIYKVLHSGRPDRHRAGNLHNEDVGTVPDGTASGEYPGRVHKWSFYAYASRHPLIVTSAAAGALALMAGLKKTRRSGP